MSDAVSTVFVIDDEACVRQALTRLLRAAGHRAEAFDSAETFLRRPPADGPACVLLDVCLPGLSGPDLQRLLGEREGGPPVVFLTGHGDVPTGVRAMKAGAVDFLTKPCGDAELLDAVGQALARHARSRQAGAVTAGLRQRAAALSPREREVMGLVVRGLLNKQVGQRLGVTEKTVKAHRAQVMRKMHADSLAELVLLAQRIGLDAAEVPAGAEG